MRPAEWHLLSYTSHYWFWDSCSFGNPNLGCKKLALLVLLQRGIVCINAMRLIWLYCLCIDQFRACERPGFVQGSWVYTSSCPSFFLYTRWLYFTLKLENLIGFKWEKDVAVVMHACLEPLNIVLRVEIELITVSFTGTKEGEKKIPESLGLAVGSVFLVCIILFQLLHFYDAGALLEWVSSCSRSATWRCISALQYGFTLLECVTVDTVAVFCIVFFWYGTIKLWI